MSARSVLTTGRPQWFSRNLAAGIHVTCGYRLVARLRVGVRAGRNATALPASLAFAPASVLRASA
jgi:hypothetical protein